MRSFLKNGAILFDLFAERKNFMVDEIKGVSKTGLGFLTQGGQLKSPEQLRKEEASRAEKSIDTDATEKSFSTDVIADSLSTVRQAFREDANRVASSLNEDDSILRDAQKIVKEQINTAKELKAALKAGDSGVADERRSDLAKLQKERDRIAQRAEEANETKLDQRVEGVRLGNRTLQTFRRDDIQFSRGEPPELDSKKDVNSLIDALQADRESLTVQRKELRETRQVLRETVDEGINSLDRLEERSIRSFSEASKTTEDLASRIRSNSQQALSFNVNESVVKQLLS